MTSPLTAQVMDSNWFKPKLAYLQAFTHSSPVPTPTEECSEGQEPEGTANN